MGSIPVGSAIIANVAELVDAQASGVCTARREGSSPSIRTISLFFLYNFPKFSFSDIASIVSTLRFFTTP